ncbi:MAG: hypothetical protein ACKOJB_14785, partial [Chthoniobacterales bacterium]
MMFANLANRVGLQHRESGRFFAGLGGGILNNEHHQQLPPPTVIYLKPNLPNAKATASQQGLTISSFRARRENGGNNSLGWQKVAFLVFLWLALAHLVVADLMWV